MFKKWTKVFCESLQENLVVIDYNSESDTYRCQNAKWHIKTLYSDDLIEKKEIPVYETKDPNYYFNTWLIIIKRIWLLFLFIALIILAINWRPVKVQELVETAWKIWEIKEIHITESWSIINAKFKIFKK